MYVYTYVLTQGSPNPRIAESFHYMCIYHITVSSGKVTTPHSQVSRAGHGAWGPRGV